MSFLSHAILGKLNALILTKEYIILLVSGNFSAKKGVVIADSRKNNKNFPHSQKKKGKKRKEKTTNYKKALIVVNEFS